MGHNWKASSRRKCMHRPEHCSHFYEELIFLSLFEGLWIWSHCCRVIGTSCYTSCFLKACVLPSSYTDSVQALINEIKECASLSDWHILLHRALIQTRHGGTAFLLPFIYDPHVNEVMIFFFAHYFQILTIFLAPSQCAILIILYMARSTIGNYIQYI